MTRLEEKLELKIQEEIIERKQCNGRLFCEGCFKDGFWSAVSHIKKWYGTIKMKNHWRGDTF